jgi:8-oxo-dGTP pyrophosphatase MutT (NUDIX family)
VTAAEVPRGAPLPRITQPRSAPVVGTDAHLAALRDEHLHPESIRARMARLQAVPSAPEFAGDGERVLASHAGRGPTPASVLVPLVHRDDGLHLLLTQRTAHLHDHAGQVSFPGGRADPGDADAVATALREAEEEVGLPPHCVEVLGCLPVYTTVTSYVVTPVVALVQPPRALQLDAFEVAEAFEVPLSFLMNPANHQRHEVDFGGLRRHFLSMPWQPPGRSDAYFIWGATAAMIRNLYRVLA